MAETQRSIQLLEGDRHAYDATAQASIRKNRDAILQLRHENKRLYRELAEVQAGDEQVIKEAFHNRGMEMGAYCNMSVKEAQTALDRRVLSSVKRLNALKHITRTYRQHLEELKAEYERATSEGSSDAHARREEEDAMNLRALENRLVKMHFKCDGADIIMTNYLKIRSHLKVERSTCQGQLDSLETEILKHKEELRRLQVKNNDAQRLKEVTTTQLEQQDKLLYKEPVERKSIIASSRRKVEEVRSKAEQVDRETLETHQRLEKMKVMNETVLQQLNEQMEFLSQQFQDMKYSREAGLSRVQRQLESCEQQLQAHHQRRDAAKERLDRLVRTLGAARARLQRLAGKLGHVALSDDAAAEASPDSDESVVELVSRCEGKLRLLCEEVQGKELAADRTEGEAEEVRPGPVSAKLSVSGLRENGRLPQGANSLKTSLMKEKTEEDNKADLISLEASISVSLS